MFFCFFAILKRIFLNFFAGRKKRKATNSNFLHYRSLLTKNDLSLELINFFFQRLKRYYSFFHLWKQKKFHEILLKEMLIYIKPKLTFQKIIYNLENNTLRQKKNSLLGVFLFVGANGVGKTTTVAKVCFSLKKNNYQVAVVAADTFRAGAETQLREKISSVPEISSVVCYGSELGKNSATIIYKSIQFALQKQTQFLLCDLAGRTENRSDLLKELTKVRSVVEKLGFKPVIFFITDATHGKFSLQQVKRFKEALELTTNSKLKKDSVKKKFFNDKFVSGLVLTKTDSFSCGGFVFPIKLKLKIDVLLVGNGEKITDLKTFNVEKYLLDLTS